MIWFSKFEFRILRASCAFWMKKTVVSFLTLLESSRQLSVVETRMGGTEMGEE